MSDGIEIAFAEGGITAPKGFMAAGVSAGLKPSGRRDIALLMSERECAAAGVFTRNQVVAAPVDVTRTNLEGGGCRAIVVNAGNANACTGEQGLADAVAMTYAVADALEIDSSEVAVASTGVIGQPMPMDLVLPGVAEAADVLDSNGGDAAAEAIMTTDTFPKQTAATVEIDGERYTVGGMAKGSGMIQPNMATMLAFVTTDAPLTVAAADLALRDAVDVTFNRVTVDGDTSTNDMCLLLANGAAGGDAIAPGSPGYAPVAAAIAHVCRELARMVARDGEGATKLITVEVRGAASAEDAAAAAFSIANSPLVKTAVFGKDANWGRVAMAVGKSSAKVDPTRLEIVFAGITTCREGTAVPFDEAAAAEALSADEVEIGVNLYVGEHDATVWTCDLSYDYVRINGEYRS